MPVLGVLREIAPDATIVVILMTPAPWYRFASDRVVAYEREGDLGAPRGTDRVPRHAGPAEAGA
jgi:hypothetical protein